MTEKKHSHYFRDVSKLESIDVYRILELFDVSCPIAQHIVKKALAAGKRGAKSSARDMQDIADSANRWLEMRQEDASTILEDPTVKPNASLWGDPTYKISEQANMQYRRHLDAMPLVDNAMIVPK
jgi:hypothetical protein